MAHYEFTSHEGFSHDSLDSLGFDWERIGDPAIAPKRPLKVYLPRTTEELVAVLREAAALGQTVKVRSKGHSSNDLVLSDGGAILCTEYLHETVALDKEAATVIVQSGRVLAELDESLRGTGLGLKVIGDHNHITAGGFASVGGISPASHRFGLFLDTVRALELVDWQGELRSYDRETDKAGLYRVLGGTGQFGVIATLTLDLQRADKYVTIVRNRRRITRNLDTFVAYSGREIADPGEAIMERGVWIEYPMLGGMLKLGQFSAYHDTRPSAWKRFRNRFSYGYLHFLGTLAGRLPGWLDRIVKALGFVGIILSPRYATMKNVETFTDRILDSSVGDPTRMFIVLAPVDRYDVLFRALNDLFRRYRGAHGCFSFVAFYVKCIRSEWLAGPDRPPFCELMLYVGCKPEALTAERLDALVAEIDALCIAHRGFRYMHTRTSKDPAIREKVDPNVRYARPPGSSA